MFFLLYSSFKTLMKTLSHMGQSYGFLLCGSFHNSFFLTKRFFTLGQVNDFSPVFILKTLMQFLSHMGQSYGFFCVGPFMTPQFFFWKNDFSHGRAKWLFSCIHPLKHWWKPCHTWDSHMVFFCVGSFMTPHFFLTKRFSTFRQVNDFSFDYSSFLEYWCNSCHIWDSHMVFFCVGPFMTPQLFLAKLFWHLYQLMCSKPSVV